MLRQSPASATRGSGLRAQPAPKHATHPKNATAAIYWYHDPLAKLYEKTPRTYRTHYLNNDDPPPLSARSDDIPTLDVRPVCRGIASQSADPLAAGLKATFEECVKSEQGVREQLKQAWPTFSEADKKHCITLAKTGGEASNTELLTCLEMSRDVRALRYAATTTPSGADVTKKKASPSLPTTRPAPSGETSQRTATKELSVSETGAPKKELEGAKSDGFTAKASEALAQRKLADAEAALQRVKDEAARATAEAERAKADAKAPRESEETAKRKLADADAARVAAEGREQACHSVAKKESGFGARFRSWFKPKQPDTKNP
jgi:hypothetical protein